MLRTDCLKRFAAAMLIAAMTIPGELSALGPLESYIRAFGAQTDEHEKASDSDAMEGDEDEEEPETDISTDSTADSDDDRPEFVRIIKKIYSLDKEVRNQELPEGEDPEDYILFPEVLEAETDDDELLEIDVEWEPEDEDTEPTELEPGDEYVYVASIEENYELKSKVKLPKINVEIVENEDKESGEEAEEAEAFFEEETATESVALMSLDVDGTTYKVGTEEEYLEALEDISELADGTEVTLLLTSDISNNDGFVGVKGKCITVTSDETAPDVGYKVKLGQEMQGDIILDKVFITTSEFRPIYANGHLFEITENMPVGRTSGYVNYGRFEKIFGGGSQGNDVESTNLVLNGGQIENVYGGGHDSNVIGDVHITMDGNANAGNFYGGGLAEDTEDGKVLGNVIVEAKQGILRSFLGGGNNQHSDASEDRMPAEVQGDIIMTFGCEGAPEDSIILASNWDSGGGSENSTVGNIFLKFLEGSSCKSSYKLAEDGSDISGAGFNDDVKGIVNILVDGGQINTVFGVGIEDYRDPAFIDGHRTRILNEDNSDDAVYIKIINVRQTNDFIIETVDGLSMGISGSQKTDLVNGDITIEIENSDVDQVCLGGRTTNYSTEWAELEGTGNIIIKDSNVYAIRGQKVNYENKKYESNVYFEGSKPSEIGYTYWVDNVTVGEGADVMIGSAKLWDDEMLPFYETRNLSVLSGAKLVTSNADTAYKAEILNDAVIDAGEWTAKGYVKVGTDEDSGTGNITIKNKGKLSSESQVWIVNEASLDNGTWIAEAKNGTNQTKYIYGELTLDNQSLLESEGQIQLRNKAEFKNSKWISTGTIYAYEDIVSKNSTFNWSCYFNLGYNHKSNSKDFTAFTSNNDKLVSKDSSWVNKIYGSVDVTNSDLAFLCPANISGDWKAIGDPILRFPAVSFVGNYDGVSGVDIPLNIDGTASGRTTVYTVDKTDENKLVTPAIGDNYITGLAPNGTGESQAQDNPIQATFVLGNDEALRLGYYLKRLDDPGDPRNYYMWQVASGISIEAMDITAYTGGDSTNEGGFPTARYLIRLPDEYNLQDLRFDIQGKTASVIQIGTASDGRIIAIITELTESFMYNDEPSGSSNSTYTRNSIHHNDSIAGIYTIDVEEKDNITAYVTTGNGGQFDVPFIPGELTVRYVSDPEGVHSGANDLAEPVILSSLDNRPERPVAVVDPNTEYKTNGSDYLSIADNQIDGESDAVISLMSDELLSEYGEDRVQPLTVKAEEKLKENNISIENRKYEFKYLDLINETDGNVWVSSSKGSDIYWPYPEGTDKSTKFEVVHFPGLHREYGFDGTENVLAAIENCSPELVTISNEDFGIKFHVPESGFSPFAVTWQIEPETPDPGEEDPDTPPATDEDDEPTNPGGNSGGGSGSGGGGGGGGSTGGGPNAITGGTFSPRPDETEKPEEEVSGDVSPHPEYNRLPVMGDEVFGPGFEAGTSRYETDENGTVIIRLTNDSADSSDMTKESEVSLETGSFNTESSESASNSGTLTNENSVSDTAQPEQRAIIPELSGYYAQNPDILGWLTVPGTGLGYPVMNNVSYPEYYLHHNFDKTPDEVGLPFTAPFCTADSDNILIHGHNMKNKLQFGYIWNYQYPSFRASHPAIDFKTLYDSGAGGYEVMAVFFGEVYPAEAQGVFKWYQYAGSMNRNQFDYYVQNVKAMSLYDTGVYAEYGDKLITLETCATTTDNTRLVVVARKKAIQ